MSADQGYKYIRPAQPTNGDTTTCQNPECKSRDIFAHHFECDTSEAWREIECHDCRAKWIETYRFVRVERLQVRI
jgi:hypothetical protein